MSYFKSAASVLLEAETKLRGIVQQAASDGDYDAVVRIAALAREVDALRGSIAAASTASHAALTTSRPVIQNKHARRGAYPSFAKQKDALVKVGWSKTSRTEYEHRAPRPALDILAAAVTEKSRGNRKFTTEDIFPLRNSDGSDIPTYQAYVCLAWLCAIGVLQKNGRQGYEVVTDHCLDDVVTQLWRELPDR